MSGIEIAVIGGSGLYQMQDINVLEERMIDTPFGKPSADIAVVELAGCRVAFLPRHGKGHRYNPTAVPVRANIFALKKLGVRFIISISAVGSLKLEIQPRDIVIPDQVIDRTRSRVNTFFDDFAVHAEFGDPFSPELSRLLYAISQELEIRAHLGGIYVCMEGPVFSTKAESALHRSWGASVIGMTALPEAKLAREAEIAYATVCTATDYDVWHTSDTVNVDMILENLAQSLRDVQRLLMAVVPQIDTEAVYPAHDALKTAIITDPSLISKQHRTELAPLIGKYLR